MRPRVVGLLGLLVWSLAVAGLGAPVASARVVVPARIDWVASRLTVTTQARPLTGIATAHGKDLAFTQAFEAATSEIRAVVGAIWLTSYTSLDDACAGGILAKDTLDEVLKGVRPTWQKWDQSRGILTLTCELALRGPRTLSEVAAQMLLFEQKHLTASGFPPRHSSQEIRPCSPRLIKQLADGPYTGVLIDCRGMGYVPALLPKLITWERTPFWGTVGLNPQRVMEQGMVGYATSVRQAMRAGRVGTTPYLLRPVATIGAFHNDLVLSREDVELLRTQDPALAFLLALPVVILID
jgi:hypothetical protein